MYIEQFPFLRPFHAGYFLKKELKARNLTAPQLAKKMGIKSADVIDVLNEKKPITVDFAHRLELAIGVPAVSFLKFQFTYDQYLIRQSQPLSRKTRTAGKTNSPSFRA